MKIPKGMTEEQVLVIIQKIVNRTCSKFVFGYYDREDIKQEAFMAAMKALEKYDNIRPLENFLQVDISNKLKNLKRDKYQRIEKPCLKCPLYNLMKDSQCDKYEDKTECDLYRNWYNRNETKKNLVTPICFTNVDDEQEDSMKYSDTVLANLTQSEVMQVIEENLPSELRKDFIKLRFGAKLSKQQKNHIQQVILEILTEKGLTDE